MTDNNQSPRETLTFVQVDEPQAKPPPALETGILKWMRENLFSSVGNSILTLIGLALVVYTLVNTTQWVVQQGNWLAITANIRQYMVGSFAPQYLWRLKLLTLFSVFIIGMSIAIWVQQIARLMAVSITVIIAVVMLLPIISKALVPLPDFYVLAGEGTIQTGSASETPFAELAFIGKADETVTIQLADEVINSEESLAALSGYASVPANTLLNAAANRLEMIAEKESLEAQLQAHAASDIPLLTQAQVEAYTAAVDAMEIPEPILETYEVNSIAVRVVILDGDTREPIGEALVLENAEDVASFTLPMDGWYILEKVDVNAVEPEAVEASETTGEAPANPQDIRNVSGTSSAQTTEAAEEVEAIGGTVAILDVKGIYPVLQSNVFNSEAGRFITGYKRSIDFFTLEENAPRDDSGSNLPFVVITSNQYRGERTFGDYIRAYVTPFFDQVNINVTVFFIFGVLGYFAAMMLARTNGEQQATQITTYGLASIPIVMWVLVNGFNFTTAIALLGVIALGLQCFAIYRLGERNGWAGWRPNGAAVDGNMIVALTIMISYVALLIMMERVTGGNWAGWILRLGFIPLIGAGLAGTFLYTPDAKDEVSGNTVVLPFLVAGGIIAAVFLTGIGVANPERDWILAASNPDNWGGFLLTMVLTVYGIMIAFPIGIGLALGRRSDLPLIKYLCIGYIELIRGSPFITVLFFMRLLIPLISPTLAGVPNGYRAIIATIAFSAAYMAENVRGGLQSLPPGQAEAAKALGLGAWQTTLLITLPQALRAVIPALVGQFISLFKDTSLVSIISLIDLTGVVNSMAVQPEFVGTRLEGLLFISIIYFVFSYVLSYISRLLEASGSGATRRMT